MIIGLGRHSEGPSSFPYLHNVWTDRPNWEKGSFAMASQAHRKAGPQIFSENSTPAVLPSLWFASDFLLGAGMVIIQPETEKIVVIYDTQTKTWFLPKGRKDIGESLEQTALREAYEEVYFYLDGFSRLTSLS